MLPDWLKAPRHPKAVVSNVSDCQLLHTRRARRQRHPFKS
jgi:hypothetical protein